MLSEIKYIEVTPEERYPFLFSLNVMEEIQEKYGSIEAWSSAIEPENGEPSLKALIDTFYLGITEGIDELKDEGETVETVSRKKVGRILTKMGLDKAAESLKGVVVDATKSGDEEKNV